MTESWSAMACTIEIDRVRSPKSGLRYCITVSSEPVGNRVELADDADAAGAATGFAHDGAGRLTQLTTPAGQPIDLAYDPAGRITGLTFPNTVSSTLQYDLATGRL